MADPAASHRTDRLSTAKSEIGRRSRHLDFGQAMKHAIVILQATDIPVAAQIVKAHADADNPCELIVFDPTLADRAMSARIGPVHYWAWHEAPPYDQRCAQAHGQARALGQAIDQALAEPPWSELAVGSWRHLSHYYLMLALNWYSALFEAMAPRLRTYKLLVPMCDNPQSYYFASFVPSLLLLLLAQREGWAFQSCEYGRAADDTPQVPDLRGHFTPPDRPFVLTHIPTCFYDQAYIDAALRRSGKAVVDLRAKYWHVPLTAEATIATVAAPALESSLPEAQAASLRQLAQRLVAPIDQHLTPWFRAPAFRARQVAQMVALIHSQLLTWTLLEQHFAAATPARLLLSDHDTDFHGPLAAYARRHRVPLVVIPHSKVSTDLEFVASEAHVLYHPTQGDTVYDVQGRRPAQAMVDMPVHLDINTRAPGPVKRIGLLLNGVALNGVVMADEAVYGPGLRRIVQWCSDRGLELQVRSRPGQTLFSTLLQPAGLSLAQLTASVQGTMADFAQRCDLCLMYDAPTTGAIELLSRGVPTLNPVSSSLTKRETACMHTALVPRGSVDQMLRQADLLIDDPRELHDFRTQQYLAFAERYRSARCLSDYF